MLLRPIGNKLRELFSEDKKLAKMPVALNLIKNFWEYFGHNQTYNSGNCKLWGTSENMIVVHKLMTPEYINRQFT